MDFIEEKGSRYMIKLKLKGLKKLLRSKNGERLEIAELEFKTRGEVCSAAAGLGAYTGLNNQDNQSSAFSASRIFMESPAMEKGFPIN